MKMILAIIAALVATQNATAAVPKNKPFVKEFYLSTPSGARNGEGGYDNAKDLGTDADLMAIEDGMVIENVYVIVDSAVAGVTAIQLGDDDSAAGFVPTVATSTFLATPQILGYNSTAKGTYLKDTSSNAQAKYYSAAGKELKLDATGTLTGNGKVRVIVEGYRGAYP
jgi:hypothetical protein